LSDEFKHQHYETVINFAYNVIYNQSIKDLINDVFPHNEVRRKAFNIGLGLMELTQSKKKYYSKELLKWYGDGKV